MSKKRSRKSKKNYTYAEILQTFFPNAERTSRPKEYASVDFRNVVIGVLQENLDTYDPERDFER